jgi:hypothetical protein
LAPLGYDFNFDYKTCFKFSKQSNINSNLFFSQRHHNKHDNRSGSGGNKGPPVRGAVQMGRSGPTGGGSGGIINPLDGPLSPIEDVSPSLEAAEQESMRYHQVWLFHTLLLYSANSKIILLKGKL